MVTCPASFRKYCRYAPAGKLRMTSPAVPPPAVAGLTGAPSPRPPCPPPPPRPPCPPCPAPGSAPACPAPPPACAPAPPRPPVLAAPPAAASSALSPPPKPPRPPNPIGVFIKAGGRETSRYVGRGSNRVATALLISGRAFCTGARSSRIQKPRPEVATTRSLYAG